MLRRRPRLLGLLLLAGALLGGCRHKSKTPEEAFQRFAAAVTARDGLALFDALDQKTRWDLMTIQKYHREAYDIVLSNYPEGPVRDREKARFERAATAASARELFRSDAAPALLPALVALAQGIPRVEPGPADGQATAVLENGQRVPFARGQDGGWGYAGLAKKTEDDTNRAYHDLEVVRASAADYERAAARAAK
ncbi:MAG TPA: hypothetical protein VHO06_02170 [Polyangia bacterium]|nr:hypothetical protein [Polyangia bacterium]